MRSRPWLAVLGRAPDGQVRSRPQLAVFAAGLQLRGTREGVAGDKEELS